MASKTRRRYGVGQTTRWGFSPYSPPPVPQGTYDPALDAQREAANRGLADLQQDTTTQNTRDTVDYGLGRDDILRGLSRGSADLGVARDQSMEDIGTNRTRVEEDYQRNLGLLQQGYQRLGVRQQQQAAGAGVLDGGALLQAAAKRGTNMAQDKEQLDAQRNRTLADLETQQQRVQQGADTQGGRMSEDTDLSLGKLALMGAPPDENNPLGGRSFQDRKTQLERGGRENLQFGIDVGVQKGAQAAASGYVPAQPPANQFVDPQGNARRIVNSGGWQYVVDRSGRVISRKRVK